MALPADFAKIFGSTFTGGLTPIGDVNYAKGWEYVGSNPPTKNDFSYLQNFSDSKSKWLYDNKLQRSDPFGDIKLDGSVAIAAALSNLGLVGGNFTSGPGYSLNYIKIPVSTPSGLVTKIIQYGVASMTAGQDNVLGLPITFPNAVRTWYATGNYTANSGTLVDVNCVAGLSSITLRASAAVSAMWLIIGE